MDSVDKLVIDFDIWFRKRILRYNDRKNLHSTFKAAAGAGYDGAGIVICHFGV